MSVVTDFPRGHLSMVDRPPPSNVEAEVAILGALLSRNDVYAGISDFLLPDHFFEPVHQRIYQAISKEIEHGNRVSPVTLKGFFETDPALRDVGGATYLGQLLGSVVTYVNVPQYGREIQQLFIRRQLMELGDDIKADASEFDQDKPIPLIVDAAENRLTELSKLRTSRKDVVSYDTAASATIISIEEAYKRKGPIGIRSGFRDLDGRIGGFRGGNLYLLGARPSIGKTTFAWGLAAELANASEAAVTAFFSQEMEADQLVHKELAYRTGISVNRQNSGDFSHDEMQRLADAAKEQRNMPIYIDTNSMQSVAAIRQTARRIKRKHGLNLIIIDHLQLMRQGGKVEARRLEIGEITAGLKSLAKELSVPVLLLSQLSRACEARDDKRPMLSDLRESGDIEQDADVVMFLYRHEYYLERQEPQKKPGQKDSDFSNTLIEWETQLQNSKGGAEIIVAKSREGQVGTVHVRFDGLRQRFHAYEPC